MAMRNNELRIYREKYLVNTLQVDVSAVLYNTQVSLVYIIIIIQEKKSTVGCLVWLNDFVIKPSTGTCN